MLPYLAAAIRSKASTNICAFLRIFVLENFLPFAVIQFFAYAFPQLRLPAHRLCAEAELLCGAQR